MNIGDKVRITSIDGFIKYGVGVIDSIGNAHAGGARVKMTDGSILEVGHYKVTKIPMPGRPKKNHSYGSRRIV